MAPRSTLLHPDIFMPNPKRRTTSGRRSPKQKNTGIEDKRIPYSGITIYPQQDKAAEDSYGTTTSSTSLQQYCAYCCIFPSSGATRSGGHASAAATGKLSYLYLNHAATPFPPRTSDKNHHDYCSQEEPFQYKLPRGLNTLCLG